MSIMDEIKKQDIQNNNKNKRDYINGDIALNIVARSLCDYIFSYILKLNEKNSGYRKIYGYVLLVNNINKLEKDTLARSLRMNKSGELKCCSDFIKYEYNYFDNKPPFVCFISERLECDLIQKVRVEYKGNFRISNYDKISCATISNPRLGYSGIVYKDNQKVYLFPCEVFSERRKVTDSHTKIFYDGIASQKLVTVGSERDMNILSQQLDSKFKEEGLKKSFFKVLNAKDYVGINVKEYKYGLFGKEKCIGSKYHTVDDNPNSKVIYFEVEW